MEILLLTAAMLVGGLLGGAFASRMGFPRITGYILAGIALNPSFLPFFGRDALEALNMAMPVAPGVISYMVGGGRRLDSVRKLGNAILNITVFQGVIPLLRSAALIAGLGPFGMRIPGSEGALSSFVPMALVLGAIAVS